MGLRSCPSVHRVSVGNGQQVTVVIAATSGIRNPSTVGTTHQF